MAYNGFGGSISADVAKLTQLKDFWAGSNDITGKWRQLVFACHVCLQAGRSNSQLCHVYYFVSIGSLPKEFAQLSQLISIV